MYRAVMFGAGGGHWVGLAGRGGRDRVLAIIFQEVEGVIDGGFQRFHADHANMRNKSKSWLLRSSFTRIRKAIMSPW